MYWTAIIMGLAGGLHCVGMCGPLVIAFTSKNPFFGSKLVYNLGRIVTYGLLGVGAGLVGSVIHLSQYQNIFAYASGVLLLLLGFGAVSGIKIPFLTPLVLRFTNFLKKLFGSSLQSKKNVFFLGMLNGFLPCGLTYLALTYCLTTESLLEGYLFMTLFGLGTIPVMTGLLWVVGIALTRFKISYRKVSMVVLITLGGLVIARAFFSHTHVSDHNRKVAVSDEVLCR